MESQARDSARHATSAKPTVEAAPRARRAWRPIALVGLQLAGVALSLYLLVARSGGPRSLGAAVVVMLAVAASMLLIGHR